MMMIGDPLRRTHHPTVQIPSWEPYESSSDPSPHHTFSPSSDPSPHHTFSSSSSHYLPVPSTDYSASDYSPSSFAADYATALNLYTSFPSDYPAAAESDSDSSAAAADLGSTLYDSFSCDEFRIYEFKVRRCVRGRSHDWTECPFAHPGEKARRRDPRRYLYSGTACPEFRKGSCKKGDACEFAHGVFECWLHPSRYRTQPCKDGVHCTRRVCFFAHSPDQLRVLPVDHQREMVISSPPVESPPVSPRGNYGEFESVGELVGAMKGLQMGCGLGKVGSPAGCWGFQLGCSPRSGGYGSSGTGYGVGVVGGSVPNTPNRGGCGPVVVSSVGGLFDDSWNLSLKEEPVMERVESGRDIRARMYAKLRRENSLDRAESPCAVPDVGWVSELVK